MQRATCTAYVTGSGHRARGRATFACLLLCSAATAQAAVAPSAARAPTCADILFAEGVLPADAVWSCDQTLSDDDTVVAASVPLSDRNADARLMLVVGISTGAGWLGRSLHKD